MSQHVRPLGGRSIAVAIALLTAVGALSSCTSRAARTSDIAASDIAASDIATSDNSASVALGPSVPAAKSATPGTVSATPSAAGHSGGDAIPDGILIGNLGVHDQSSSGRTVTLGAEIDGAQGWVAIRSDNHGIPGMLLGLAHRANGQHGDTLTIILKSPVRTGYCWAILHIDAGRIGRYEVPGPDKVLDSGGEPLTRRFLVTVP